MAESKVFSISDCQIIELNKIMDARGALTFIEGGRHVPFEIKRVYYLYDIHAGSSRAGHAHKALYQLLIPVSGSFAVHLDDGFEKTSVTLKSPHKGLLVTPMIWRVIDDFSSGAVCVVLASLQYDESDYYRNYDEFIAAAQTARQQQITVTPQSIPAVR